MAQGGAGGAGGNGGNGLGGGCYVLGGTTASIDSTLIVANTALGGCAGRAAPAARASAAASTSTRCRRDAQQVERGHFQLCVRER